jgi:hypothetical protein
MSNSYFTREIAFEATPLIKPPTLSVVSDLLQPAQQMRQSRIDRNEARCYCWFALQPFDQSQSLNRVTADNIQ